MGEKINVDTDRYEFLWYTYFGNASDVYKISSYKAYRDFCRTLRFNGQSGEQLRLQIDNLLSGKIKEDVIDHRLTQVQYDNWHRSLCNEMIEIYNQENIEFNIGHAQKWINMTMKYLYIHGGVDMDSIFDLLHVPIDQYVFGAAEKTLSIERPCAAWSKIKDYNIYLDYQKRIRLKIDGAPLSWELTNWLKEAKERSKKE